MVLVLVMLTDPHPSSEKPCKRCQWTAKCKKTKQLWAFLMCVMPKSCGVIGGNTRVCSCFQVAVIWAKPTPLICSAGLSNHIRSVLGELPRRPTWVSKQHSHQTLRKRRGGYGKVNQHDLWITQTCGGFLVIKDIIFSPAGIPQCPVCAQCFVLSKNIKAV